MSGATAKNTAYAGEVTCIAPVSPRDTNMKIEGWAHIFTAEGSFDPVRVELLCGDTVLRSHLANLSISTDPAGNPCGFRFFVSNGLMRRVGKDEVLRVRIAGALYDIPCKDNVSFESLSRSKHSTGDLESLIKEGWIVSHWGGLEVPFSVRPERKLHLLDLYSRLRKIFEDELALQLYILGGNLLGLAREGKFLDHDYDLDAGICFSAKNPEDAALIFIEFYEKAKKVLTDRNFNVKIKNTGHFQIMEASGEKLGIFFAWITPDGYYFRPTGKGGHLGSSELTLESVEYLGYEIFIPQDRYKKLTLVYGDSWRQPDIGFFPTKSAEVQEAMRRFHAKGWKRVKSLREDER